LKITSVLVSNVIFLVKYFGLTGDRH